jgi:hypothetical protein
LGRGEVGELDLKGLQVGVDEIFAASHDGEIAVPATTFAKRDMDVGRLGPSRRRQAGGWRRITW